MRYRTFGTLRKRNSCIDRERERETNRRRERASEFNLATYLSAKSIASLRNFLPIRLCLSTRQFIQLDIDTDIDRGTDTDTDTDMYMDMGMHMEKEKDTDIVMYM